MYNKVSTENPKYRRLKWSSLALFAMAIFAAALMVFCGVLNSRNLNGNVREAYGTITFIGEDKNEQFVIVLDDKDTYMANPVRDYLTTPDNLVNKEVTLLLPLRQIESTYPWILGIKQDDSTIVDYNVTISNMRKNNTTVMGVCGAIMGALILASGGLYVWQKKTSPSVETDLYVSYCEYSLLRQPSCPAYRKSFILNFSYWLIVVIYVVLFGIVFESVDLSDAVRIVLNISVNAVFISVSVIFAILYWVWLPKKEREFYSTNYPFDFTDLSHVAIRKKVKEQLQRELIEERRNFPHRYADGGNGYLCDFTENGISLSLEFPDEPYESVPDVQDVFDTGGETPETEYLCDISYEQLNLEALPYYRKKDHCFYIVIKSRLQSPEILPNPSDMSNDLHFILDTNLLATLRRFNVYVENLDNLLNNKAQLIEENCNRFSKRNRK